MFGVNMMTDGLQYRGAFVLLSAQKLDVFLLAIVWQTGGNDDILLSHVEQRQCALCLIIDIGCHVLLQSANRILHPEVGVRSQ